MSNNEGQALCAKEERCVVEFYKDIVPGVLTGSRDLNNTCAIITDVIWFLFADDWIN